MATNDSSFFSQTTRTLARKLNQQVSRVRDPASFPQDVLKAAEVEIQFLQHIGFPESADSVAYEPVQKLLAVGTSDGRVKLIGRAGVEATLRGDSIAPTKYLGFLRHRGALLRITQDGNVQLYSVAGRRILSSVWVEDDTINTVSVVPGGPYVMLGCESGDCSVVLVSSRRGESSGGDDPAAGLVLQPYKILGEDLDASGGVIALAIARNEERPLALIVHKNSGALIWDIRAERVLCAAPDDEDDPSKPTCACWVGDRSNCFAVGYDDGSILVWGVPSAALKANAARVAASQDAILVMSLRVIPEGTAAAPVQSLTFLPGTKGTPGEEDCLLVCGGQGASDPDMLTLVPLDPEGTTGALTVPWFGDIKAHALMPRAGSLSHVDAPDALMVLTEGGQLVVHDLKEWHPYPLTLPFQELPPITNSKFVPTLSSDQAVEAGLGGTSAAPSAVQHAFTLDKLHSCSRKPGEEHGYARAVDDAWPFTGGQPAAVLPSAVAHGCHPSALLCTGHRDGRVRVWDTTAQVPCLLSTVPSSVAVGQERMRPVTSIDVCPVSGLAAVGHAGGDVRVYQFSDRPQAVRRACLDESLVPYDTLLAQPAGLQYILKYSTHAKDITAVVLASRLRLLVVGDASGCVTAVDLTQPQRVFTATPVQDSPVVRLSVGRMVVAPSTSPDQPPVEGDVVFVASEDSSLSLLSLQTGELITRPLRPKNASKPLDLTLLDAHGVPILPPMGPVVLPWADNNAAAAPRTLRMMSVNQMSLGRRRASTPAQEEIGSPEPLSSAMPTANSLEVQELSSEDEEELDAALNAAAAAVEEAEGTSKGGNGKLRFSLFRRRSGSPDKLAAAGAMAASLPASRSASASPTRTPPGSLPYPSPRLPVEAVQSSSLPEAPPPVAAEVGYDSDEIEAVPEEEVDTEADLWGQAGGNSVAAATDVESFLSSGAPPGETVDYPHFADAVDGEVPPVAFVLLATAEYFRVYSVENILACDRTTDRKARLESPAGFASVFLSEHGPGIVSVSQDCHIAVHSVPGLDLLVSHQLRFPEGLGFPWSAPDDTSATSWACSLDGQVLLTAPTNELARMAVVREFAMPAGAASTFDWDVAKAAKAAAAAAGGTSSGNSRPQSLEIPSPGPDYMAGVPTPGSTRATPTPTTTRGANFMTSVKGAASGLVDSASAATSVVMQEIDRVRGMPPREIPTLKALFEKPVSSLAMDDDDLDFLPEGDEDGSGRGVGAAAAAQAAAVAGKAKDLATSALQGAAQHGAKLKNMLPMGRRDSDDLAGRDAARASEDLAARERRNELLGTPPVPRASTPEPSPAGGTSRWTPKLPTSASSSGKKGSRIHRRTASEVKRVYGHTRAQDARAVMERNKEMLALRGEKLKNLDEKSAAMQNDAEDFASLAQELESAFANRKWWHF